MNGYYAPPVQQSSDAGAIVVVIFIILIIIALVVYYFYHNSSPRTSTGFTWNVIAGGTGTTNSFNASAGNAYVVPSNLTGNYNLTLVPPVNAVGQEFAVINNGASTVIMTAPGNTYNLQPHTTQTFIWLSQTTFSLI